MEKASKEHRAEWELHVVAHSAGSIFATFALDQLASLSDDGVQFKTLQFLAPAATVELFREEIVPRVEARKCPPPTSYILSDPGELDDDVGPYGKSLLYLVSNAFERDRATPLIGMEKFVRRTDKLKAADEDIAAFFARRDAGLPRLVVSGEASSKAKPGTISRSDSHGGFDNDHDTLNSVLFRILGETPKRLFDIRDLQY